MNFVEKEKLPYDRKLEARIIASKSQVTTVMEVLKEISLEFSMCDGKIYSFSHLDCLANASRGFKGQSMVVECLCTESQIENLKRSIYQGASKYFDIVEILFDVQIITSEKWIIHKEEV